MDYQLRSGLFITFASLGVGLLFSSFQYIGIGFLVLAVICWFLFLNTKSPVKRKCWINSKLGISIDGEPTFKEDRGVLQVYMDIVALSEVDIEALHLESGGNRFKSDWDSDGKTYWERKGKVGHDCIEVHFTIPKQLPSGKYTMRLIATTDYGLSRSPKREIDIPRRGSV